MSEHPHKECPFSVFRYNPEEGTLYRTDLNRFVGTLCKDTGYSRLTFQNKSYLSHRLIWYLQKSTWPDQIDHVNGDRSDNTWTNLREVSSREQSFNKKGWSSCGVKGVYWHKSKGKWHTRVRADGKVHQVGYYDSLEEAAKAYQDKAKHLHKEFFNGEHISSTLSLR